VTPSAARNRNRFNAALGSFPAGGPFIMNFGPHPAADHRILIPSPPGDRQGEELCGAGPIGSGFFLHYWRRTVGKNGPGRGWRPRIRPLQGGPISKRDRNEYWAVAPLSCDGTRARRRGLRSLASGKPSYLPKEIRFASRITLGINSGRAGSAKTGVGV